MLFHAFPAGAAGEWSFCMSLPPAPLAFALVQKGVHLIHH